MQMSTNTKRSINNKAVSTKSKHAKKRSKVLFTPKDLVIFILAFLYATTNLTIDTTAKAMLFMIYTIACLMVIMILKEA